MKKPSKKYNINGKNYCTNCKKWLLYRLMGRCPNCNLKVTGEKKDYDIRIFRRNGKWKNINNE